MDFLNFWKSGSNIKSLLHNTSASCGYIAIWYFSHCIYLTTKHTKYIKKHTKQASVYLEVALCVFWFKYISIYVFRMLFQFLIYENLCFPFSLLTHYHFTTSAYYHIVTLSNYQISTLPHYRIFTLPHSRITTLPHYHITALSH